MYSHTKRPIWLYLIQPIRAWVQRTRHRLDNNILQMNRLEFCKRPSILCWAAAAQLDGQEEHINENYPVSRTVLGFLLLTVTPPLRSRKWRLDGVQQAVRPHAVRLPLRPHLKQAVERLPLNETRDVQKQKESSPAELLIRPERFPAFSSLSPDPAAAAVRPPSAAPPGQPPTAGRCCSGLWQSSVAGRENDGPRTGRTSEKKEKKKGFQ